MSLIKKETPIAMIKRVDAVCPQCGNPLQFSSCEAIEGSSAYEFTCPSCGNFTTYDFEQFPQYIVAPMPPSGLEAKTKAPARVVALTGPSACGKDTILRTILRRYPDIFHSIEKYTTRPKRIGEVDCVDYHFVSEKEFNKIDFCITEQFREWHYGYKMPTETDKPYIGVFTPEAVKKLQDQGLLQTCYYIIVPPEERLLRSLQRETKPDIDEILRRYYADKKDYSIHRMMDILDINFTMLPNGTMKDLEESIQTIIERSKMN